MPKHSFLFLDRVCEHPFCEGLACISVFEESDCVVKEVFQVSSVLVIVKFFDVLDK